MRSGNFEIEGKLQGDDKDRLENNSILNAFRIAINGSLSVQNFIDGITDELEDETGIDTASSTNERYNSTNDYYDPDRSVAEINTDTKLMLHLNNNVTDASDSAHTVTNNNVTFDAGTKKWGSHSGVFNGTNATLTIPDSPDWDIVGSVSETWTIDLWVKLNEHAAPPEIFICQRVDGSNTWYLDHSHGSGLGFTVNDGGATIIATGGGGEIADSNWHHICLVIKGSGATNDYGIYKDGIQVKYLQDNSTATFAGILIIGENGAGIDTFVNGYIDEIKIQKSNSFSASPNVGLTDTITVPTSEYTDVSAMYNMTLLSNGNTADSQPDESKLIILEEDVDSITLNTDLKAYVSRDGGTTYTQITLIDEGNFDSSKQILVGEVDISGQPAGTSMKYKIETLNTKDLKIHGVSQVWR